MLFRPRRFEIAFAMPYWETIPIKESMMSYQSATDVLPADLIKEIQRYMDGGCLYIPSSKRKSLGSQNGSRALYRQRDMEIYQAHQHGVDAVSYTHLDVYKRQEESLVGSGVTKYRQIKGTSTIRGVFLTGILERFTTSK